MQETQVQSLGREDPLEKEMATHSSTLGWKTPWTEEPGSLPSMGSQRVGHDWATSLSKTTKKVLDSLLLLLGFTVSGVSGLKIVILKQFYRVPVFSNHFLVQKDVRLIYVWFGGKRGMITY